MKGFSNVNVNLLDDDDEEDRDTILERAEAKLKAAQEAYGKRGSTADVLAKFEEVEMLMQPLLQHGLTGTKPKELELVLKGRLHQAAILAPLENQPDRWPKVKALVEDVLAFDSSNCHALWLRALALQNGGLGSPGEVESTMKEAIQTARSAGKLKEAEQWEAEVARLRATAAEAQMKEAQGKPTGSGPIIEELEEDSEEPLEASTASAAPTSTATAKAPAAEKSGSGAGAAGLQKGFFNRPSAKSSEETSRKTAPAGGSGAGKSGSVIVGDGKATSSTSTSAATSAKSATPANAELTELINNQKRQLESKELELAALRASLEEERTQNKENTALMRSQQEKDKALDSLGRRMQEQYNSAKATWLQSKSSSASREQAESQLATLKADWQKALALVEEAREAQKSERSWAETEHGRYLEVATELLALKDIVDREGRDRTDTSKQRSAQYRSMSSRMAKLRAPVKQLRDHVKLRLGKEALQEETDVQQLSALVADFKALPLATKLRTLLDDVAMLKIVVVAMFLGMLCALGFFVEVPPRLGYELTCLARSSS